MKTSCLVLAGGEGTRFGMEKQFFSWRSKMLWQISYNLAKDISKDVVCVGLDIESGNTRQESVAKGLEAIDGDRVVIIEIVRPLITVKQVEDLLAVDYPSVTYGLTPETPVYSYQKNAYSTPEDTAIIQNLQAFDTKLLRQAHKETNIINAADDTILMHDVHLSLIHI